MARHIAHIIGPLSVPEVSLAQSSDGIVIAVDEGLDRAREARIAPDIAVGDFDSVSTQGLTWLDTLGSDIEIHQVEARKDFSDLDLALRVCQEQGIEQVILQGFIGGRIDHQLVVLGVCAQYATDMKITLVDERQMIFFLVATQSHAIEAETEFSLLSLEGTARVSIKGARYPLSNHLLTPLSDLGLSNYATNESTVAVHEGICILIENKIPR